MSASASPTIDRFGLVIGAMKAGTTSLFRWLASHPEVSACSEKEPDFFSREERWERGPAAYRALWTWRPERHRIAVEASTSYTMRPAVEGVAARIHAFEGADFRFVYLLRDPLQRIRSHLSHLATRRGDPGRVGEEDLLRAIEVSRYAMQLEPYGERWPRDRVLPLLHEEMRDDPAGAFERVRGFLGLAPWPDGGPEVGGIHNAREEMAADQALSRLLDRYPWLGSLRGRIPEAAHRAVRVAIGRWESHEAALPEAWRRRALRELRGDVARLREEWGVDTGRWSLGFAPGEGP